MRSHTTQIGSTVLAAVIFLVTGCSEVSSSSVEPAERSEVTISSAPATAPIEVDESPIAIELPNASNPLPTETSMPLATPAPTYLTKYEFLGEGSANIVYVREGRQIIHETVTLPHEIILNSGPGPTDPDIYLSAAAAYTSESDIVGCRITLNNRVIDELLPVPGSRSAACNSL